MAALWAVCAAVVIAPTFAPFGSIMPFDQQRMLQVAACAAAILFSAFSKPAAREVTAAIAGTSPFWRIACAGAFGLGAVSAATGAHTRAALVEVSQLAMVVLATFAVGAAVRAQRRLAVDLLAATIAAAAALAAVDLSLRLAAMETANVFPVRPTALFERFQNPRFFAQWMTWVLPLMAVPAARAQGLPWKAPAWAVRAVWAGCWTFALLAAGRGTFVAQAFAIVVVAAVFRERALPWGRAYVTTAIAGVALYFASALLVPRTWSELSDVVARLGSVSDSGRFEIWRAAAGMITGAPFLGAGPRAMSYDPSLPVAHPHNSILQWASEWGVLATLLMVTALVRALAGWLRRRSAQVDERSLDTITAVSLATALVGAALHSLLCGVLVMPVSQLMLVLTAGCALGLDTAARPRASDSRWWAPAVAVVLLVWIVTSRTEIERVVSREIPPSIQDRHLRPRLWHDETSVLGTAGAAHPARRPLRHP